MNPQIYDERKVKERSKYCAWPCGSPYILGFVVSLVAFAWRFFDCIRNGRTVIGIASVNVGFIVL